MLYKPNMKFWTSSNRQRGFGKVAVVCLMLCLWFGTLALAAAPQLHCLLHDESQNPNHHCLVTQLHEDLLLAGCATLAAPLPACIDAARACHGEFLFLASEDYRLSPSRAPPSVFSSVRVVG
jgi:hypothetical protein